MPISIRAEMARKQMYTRIISQVLIFYARDYHDVWEEKIFRCSTLKLQIGLSYDNNWLFGVFMHWLFSLEPA